LSKEAAMRQVKCRDAGEDCDAVLTGRDDEEVIAKAKEHVKQHGMKEWNADLEQKVRGIIKNA
jgi:predicted small metal-binding protein